MGFKNWGQSCRRVRAKEQFTKNAMIRVGIITFKVVKLLYAFKQSQIIMNKLFPYMTRTLMEEIKMKLDKQMMHIASSSLGELD
jgi:hypothetical protein